MVAMWLASGMLAGHLHLAVGLMAGLLLPVYSICVAHANDHLIPTQIIPASGTMVLAVNVGILAGALSGPAIVGLVGPAELMMFFAIVSGLTVLVALFRVARTDPPEETRVAQALSPQGVQMAR